MRLRRMQTRIKELEKLLGHLHTEVSWDFDNKVTRWLIQNEEYRSLSREIFERGCESDGGMSPEAFERIITAGERALLERLNRESEAAVRSQGS